MTATTEQQLLSEFVSTRSEDAFQSLVGLHIDMVLGCALRITRDRGLAEEIAQNVFTVLARKASRLKAGAGLAGWLHKTTLYETKHALRGRSRRERKMKALAEHEQIENLSSTPEDDVLPLVDEAIDALPEGDRQLVLLHYLEGRSFAEISASLGKSEGACQKQASRAIAKLRTALGRRGAVASVAALGSLLTAGSAKAAPAALVSTISSGAITGAASLTSTSLLVNAIQTMTYAKTKIAVLVAAAAAVPIGVQFKANHDLKEDLRGYEQVETAFAAQSERLAQLERAIVELPGGGEAIAKLGGPKPMNGRGIGQVAAADPRKRDLGGAGLGTRGGGKKSDGVSVGSEEPEETKPESALASLMGNMGEMEDWMDNPAMRQLVEKQMEVQIEVNYGALFDHLELSDEQRALVSAAMLEKSLGAIGSAGALSLGDPEVVSQIVAESAEYDAKLKELFGEEDFEVFKRYEESQAERQELTTFRSSLEAQGQELTFELENQLMAIMHEEGSRTGVENLSEGSSSEVGELIEPPEGLSSDIGEQLNEIQNGIYSPELIGSLMAQERGKRTRVLQRAAEILSPEQLEAFRSNQQSYLEMMQNSFNMLKKAEE